jgi:hypothetical protein
MWSSGWRKRPRSWNASSPRRFRSHVLLVSRATGPRQGHPARWSITENATPSDSPRLAIWACEAGSFSASRPMCSMMSGWGSTRLDLMSSPQRVPHHGKPLILAWGTAAQLASYRPRASHSCRVRENAIKVSRLFSEENAANSLIALLSTKCDAPSTCEDRFLRRSLLRPRHGP